MVYEGKSHLYPDTRMITRGNPHDYGKPNMFFPFRRGGVDLFLMKFDSIGAHQWTAQRGGPGEDAAHALQVRQGIMRADAPGNIRHSWLK